MEHMLKVYIAEARSNLLDHNYGKAFAFYLLVLKIAPHVRKNCYDEFSASWREWSNELRTLGRIENLFTLYQQGCDAYFDCDMLHYHMGCQLHRLGMKLEAVGMFRKALVANSYCQPARVNLENATRGLVDSWHFTMLNDKARNQSFESGIQRAMETLPCDVHVLDIGSGTGLLSMMAAQLKSCTVYACEMSKAMHTISEECISLNQLSHQIKTINQHSEHISVSSSDSNRSGNASLPQKVDLVISETLDAGVFGEGVVDTLNHAWKHLLKAKSQGGKVLPNSVTLFCCVIESEAIRRKHCLMNKHEKFQNVTISSCVGNQFKSNSGNLTFVPTVTQEPYTSETIKNIPHKVLTNPETLFKVDFNNPDLLDKIATGNHENITIDLPVVKNGTPDAVVMWFDLKVTDGYHIITDIESQHCWEQAVYPVQCFSQNNETLKQFIDESSTIRLTFKVETDCLRLMVVESLDKDGTKQDVISQFSSVTLTDFQAHVLVPEVQMLRLNDCVYSELYCKSVLSFEYTSLHVLDVSHGFSLRMVKLANNTGSISKLSKYCYSEKELKAFQSVFDFCTGTTKVECFLELPEPSPKYEVVISDIVEPSGLFVPNMLRNFAKFKDCLLPGGKFIPNKVTVVAQLIHSDEILSKCMLVSDENTLGFKIAATVNDFKVTTHSDLDMQTVQYIGLTPPKDTLTINFNDSALDGLDFKKTAVFQVTKKQTLHAVLFWFKINLYDDVIINTIDNDNHWLQAAYVLPNSQQLNLTIGDEVVLNTTLHNDSLLFSASKYGS
nr:protein arginine N-methyltransferase 9 [Ciona intestinalis]|eukprot:XP_002131379.1 protein arginine N-methyltransferase 9 [Ciona intestinalis]